MHYRKLIHLLVAVLLLGSTITASAQSFTPPRPDLLVALRQQSSGEVSIAYHAETGKVRFIGTQPGQPLRQAGRLKAGVTPEKAAGQFLSVYGPLFGLSDPGRELQVMRTRSGNAGHPSVRYQQVHHGIPVFGGEVIVNLDGAQDVLSVVAEVLPDLEVAVAPQVEAGAARELALSLVAKLYGLNAEGVMASEPELWLYNPALVGASGAGPTTLVWRVEVEPMELLPVRELVLVDARLKKIALHYNQVDTVLSRKVYDSANTPMASSQLPGTNLVRSEGGPATGISDADNAYDFAGATYQFYYSNHERDSIDGTGAELVSTVRYCPNSINCPYVNAFWNGEQMVYGEGFSEADDVVAHEITHAVTDYESGLFYYMQSGAINEFLSDLWGELIDQANIQASDTQEVLWIMGEDLLALGQANGFDPRRSMSNPPAFEQPDRMSSELYYCGAGDEGGVHINSGIGSKAAYLMAAGGDFNGFSIAGIGNQKVAKIFYAVQTSLLTSGSDYLDLYTATQQACSSLIDGGVTTAEDCQEVKKALDAVEMYQPPKSCGAAEAPVCGVGETPTILFSDDFEQLESQKWVSAPVTEVLAGNVLDEWYHPQPQQLTYTTSGVYNLWGNDSGEGPADYAASMASSVALPPGSSSFLRFHHAFDFEILFGLLLLDGGVVEYSLNGGATWADAGSLLRENGYSVDSEGTPLLIDNGWGNPLGGRPGFVGMSYGYTSSRLNLSSLAGQSVRFRFRIGTSLGSIRSGGGYGWFIDDVQIYSCPTGATTPLTVFLPMLQTKFPALPAFQAGKP